MSTNSALVCSAADGRAEYWKQYEGEAVEGQFHLRQFLGGSEHSAVFLTARQGEPAAIKLVLADPAEAELQLARWRRAGALSHPHLLRLYEMGRCQIGGRAALYLVMEYAAENLAQILAERPLTPSEAREMLSPVLDALAFLHSQRLVHGHIKPANIMARDDQLKISSDSICAASERACGYEQSGDDDAPETIRTGRQPEGDIWSMGLMLVQTLTQKKPAWQAGTEPAVPENLPTPFDEIARHCLQIDPQRRWNAAQIAAHLRPTTVPAQPTSVVPAKPGTRPRYLVSMLVGVVVLALILTGMWLLRRAPGAQRGPVAKQDTRRAEAQERTNRRTSGTKSPARIVTARPGTARSAGNAAPGSVQAGGIVQQVLPKVPQKALNTIRGTVRVRLRLKVDVAGSVTGAVFESRGPSQYFARLAMDAARQWKFEPAITNGHKVPSTWVLWFAFRRTGIQVVPTRV